MDIVTVITSAGIGVIVSQLVTSWNAFLERKHKTELPVWSCYYRRL